MYKTDRYNDWGSVTHSPPERNNNNFSTTPSTQIMENLMENLNILNKRVDEIKLNLSDYETNKRRMTIENADLLRQLHDLNANACLMLKTKSTLASSLDEKEVTEKEEIYHTYKAYKDSNDRKDSKGRENVDINTEFLQCKNCQTLLSTLKVSNKIIQEYNSKLKQINALQRQQTKPHLQYKQNSNGIKKRVEVKIKQLEPCILCKGDHGLYNCPKIDDVQRGTLKMPPNICYQHCNIRSSRCQNPCKGKLTYTNQNGDANEIDVLCSVHGKYHKRLCRTGNCKKTQSTKKQRENK